MTIQEIYDLAIKEAAKADFRSEKEIKERQERIKKKYEKMSKEEKEGYDKERLTNPYSDGRILYGNPQKKSKKYFSRDRYWWCRDAFSKRTWQY